MKQTKPRFWSMILAPVLALCLAAPAAAVSQSELESAVSGSAAYMLSTVKSPQVGSIGGEWAVIGLARSGYSVPQAYWDSYYKTVEDYVKACGGVLHDKKYTEYSRVILALTAIGADPTDVAGYDLTKPLGDFDKTVWQGVNGPIWALIALDSGNYALPANPQAAKQATRQMYIDEILSRQLDGGGWNLTDKGGSGPADPDITGMALQALAKYQDQAAVKTATDKALGCLGALQDSAGGYSSWGSTNSESVVQVLVALGELGIGLNDSRFVKNGHTLLDNLLSFRQKDGGFLHTGAGAGSNQMASEQGFYGIVAALRAMRGESSLYRMSDTGIQANGDNMAVGLPGKDPAVQKREVVSPGKTFDDISGKNAHANQAAIEALAARGILNGKSVRVFDPDAGMTRAEFAAMVVRALGLAPKAADKFTDVPASAWYAAEVGTAYTYGIINGVGGGKFNPAGAVTRQEGAAMAARAAKLCGMDTELEDAAARNILAQFGDYLSAAQWARSSLAFCYREGILDQSDMDIRPQIAIKRSEMAQMLFNLLGSANLL